MPKTAPPPNLLRQKYGAEFQPLVDPVSKRPLCPLPDWKLEARMYLCSPDKAPSGWLGKAEHFRRMASIIFASPKAKNPFEWNPNAVEISERYFQEDFLGVAAHGSAAKTECIAVIAIGEFIADPANTGCLMTSTTLAESRGRVWGRVEYRWQDLCDYFGGEQNTPGELVSSSGLIRYRLGGRKDDTRGVKLVPGRESEVKEGIGRMKGFKARRLRLFADELSDLSHKLLEAAESNLFINPDFKMVGCFNPASHFDPAGVFAEPENGWGSVDVLQSSGWKTRRGYCIRFDGESSPNVVAGYEKWRGLLTKDKLEEARKNLGDNSPRFMEQYRGAWSETGHADGIYSEAEIIKYQGMAKVEVWDSTPTMAGGFDPSFVHGGDRSVLVAGKSGRAVCFGKILPCVEITAVEYLDDNLDTSKDKKEQVVERLKLACIKHKIDPKNLAMDATGGGDIFATLMSRDPFFGTGFMKVQFGGTRSTMTLTSRKEKFFNLASEIWYAGKPLLRMGQIKGLKPEIVREMTLRLYTEASGGKKQIKIEPKEDMKKRLNGRSCDTSDSTFLMIHVCRSRLGLVSAEASAKTVKSPQSEDPMAGMFSWGVKKKPKINQPDWALSEGSGWADNEESFSG